MGLSLVVSSSVDVAVDPDARPMDMDRSFVVFLFCFATGYLVWAKERLAP